MPKNTGKGLKKSQINKIINQGPEGLTIDDIIEINPR
jgi:hypothetical protein